MPKAPRPKSSKKQQLALAAPRPGIAGVDEAGRGPLAGPVVTAAVLFPDPSCYPDGLNDSKALTLAKREALFDAIFASAHVGVASASPARIDAMNIRAASLWAMGQALRSLPQLPDHALIDGRDSVPDSPCPCAPVIGGDGKEMAIAAASIIAKVLRDRMMVRACKIYPAYGFSAHKGYGTAVHRSALAEQGPCPLHRMSFAPVRLAASRQDRVNHFSS